MIDLLRIARACFGLERSSVHFTPAISSAVATAVEGVHEELLRQDRRLLVVLLSPDGTSVVMTPRGLGWRRAPDPPAVLAWERLAPEAIGAGPELTIEERPVPIEPALALPLRELLVELASELRARGAGGGPYRSAGPLVRAEPADAPSPLAARLIVEAASEHFGDSDSVFHYPSSIATQSNRVHGWYFRASEAIAVLVSPLHGEGDASVAFTPVRLCWHNFQRGPRQVEWTYADPRSVRLEEDGVHVAGGIIDLAGSPLAPPLAALIADLAHRAQGSGSEVHRRYFK